MDSKWMLAFAICYADQSVAYISRFVGIKSFSKATIHIEENCNCIFIIINKYKLNAATKKRHSGTQEPVFFTLLSSK
jgi:hypothetical protein